MRFIAVDIHAAEEIISDRLLQSVEFEHGRALAALLQGEVSEIRISARIEFLNQKDGLFILLAAQSPSDYVVFDRETCGLFDGRLSPGEVLLCFQKVLRFAVKYWGSMRLSITEKLIPESSKAVIFPFPISQHTSFRISIELEPDRKRQIKRSPTRQSLLVYRSGKDEGGGPKEEASLTNFRRFLDARQSARQGHVAAGVAGQASITSLSVTSLDAVPEGIINPYQGYDRWLELLTEKQKSFVTASLTAPHRIEGPAGTGKTMCLILKAITGLRQAEREKREQRTLFVTHSDATRRTVQQLFEANDPSSFLEGAAQFRSQSLKLTTLQQLCGELLRREIKETEFLDRDAMESKQLQILYVNEALSAAMKADYPTHKSFLSTEFDLFLRSTTEWVAAEMLQHEISVVIKGRAGEQLENYRLLPRLRYGLPTQTPADRGFVWCIFRKYQEQLQTVAQFDTDDIVLTTIGQLDTPIWRRRRTREGYHAVFVDETHLFNINELSIFHHLSKSSDVHPIAYSVDRSQAVGDRGWTDGLFEETLSPDPTSRGFALSTEVREIFRCSPEIVNLAFAVTSAGATLFTNFDDPLKVASSMFTAQEERKCAPPCVVTCADDDAMIQEAFVRADKLAKELDASRCDVALVAFSDELFKKAAALAVSQNKPVELLKRRGDIEAVQRANKSSRYVLSAPEYIGGLDFDAVVLIGVDDGRVPPARTTDSMDSANFLSYASHNRLYVAITRARFRLEVLVTKERGPSSLLRGAIASGVLQEQCG